MKFSLIAAFCATALAAIVPVEQLERRGGATCGNTFYSAQAVDAANKAACKYVNDDETAGSSSYPHQYKNFEGFEFKGLSGPFYEFPILSSGKVYSGGSPGADRVIIDGSCTEAGQITHKGASGNKFVACAGTS